MGVGCPISLDCLLPTFLLAQFAKTTISVSGGAVYFVFAVKFFRFCQIKQAPSFLNFFMLNSTKHEISTAHKKLKC